MLNTHLYPAFGRMFLSAITSDDVQKFMLGYASLSKSLVDKIMMTLRQIFNAAVDDEHLTRSPMNKVRPPEGTTGERIPLTLSQAAELLTQAREHKYGLLPILMLYTGLRRGEALGLRWEDIRDDHINVMRAVTFEQNKRSVVGETKTDAGLRRVPLLPELADALGKRGTGYVFGGENVLPPTTFKRHWDALQTDIPVLQGVSPHKLRHTYLMLLRRAGVDGATQQYLMGHADYETTANVYTHIDGADIADARTKMATMLPDLLPKLLPKLLPQA